MGKETSNTKKPWRLLIGDKTFSIDIEHQSHLIKLVLFCSIPVLFVFTVFNLSIGFTTLAWIQFAGTIVLTSVLLSSYFYKPLSTRAFEIWILCTATIVFHSLIIYGGYKNSGIYWVSIFPFFAFLLVGLYRGWFWVFIFTIIGIVNVYLLSKGIIHTPYDVGTLTLYFSTFLFYTLVASIFSGIRERYQSELKQSNQSLEEARKIIANNNQTLEQQVQQRTAELNTEVQQHKETNTALKNKEKEFQQAQKMEALGTLISGFAHDFNNMLSGINANLFMVKRRYKDDSDTQKRFEDIEHLIFYASDMIRQLLTFARKDHLELKVFNATSFFSEAYKLAELSISETITLESNFPHEKLYIKGNATQLQQVMMNLINNAKDALSQAKYPTIHIQLEHVQPDSSFKEQYPEIQYVDYAKLSISDNGSGIDEEKLKQIFEPFFTTKEVGQGTGLGLAMCYGAIQSHQGIIDVQSCVGKGTTFSIYLPLQKAPNLHTHQNHKKELQQSCGETILIVDDDEHLRMANSQVLQSLGYKTLMASNGSEAVKVFKEHQADIQLIFMDVMMPVMGGVEAAQHIHQMQEDTPILFTTGHDKERTLDGRHPLQAGQHVLNKPFTIEELIAAIQHHLK